MLGHVKYELKTSLYAARDRETAKTNKLNHPRAARTFRCFRNAFGPSAARRSASGADAERAAHARSHHQPSAPGQDHHASVLLPLASLWP